MILFPAIDLKDGRCVRLKRGLMDQATVFRRTERRTVIQVFRVKSTMPRAIALPKIPSHDRRQCQNAYTMPGTPKACR